jgi:hypothetical protein
MINISDKLSEELADEVQIVRPSVKAWMADIRYLSNIKTITTTHRLDKQILDRSPILYLNMDRTKYSASSTSPLNRIGNNGSSRLDFGIGQSGTSGGNFVITANNTSAPNYYYRDSNYYEALEPRRIEDKFLASENGLLSHMRKSTSPDDYDGRFYSWETGGYDWSVSSNQAIFSDYRAANISYKPILRYDTQGLDHYVDFKYNTSIADKSCAVVRYIDSNNFIYVVDNTTLTTGSIQIVKRENGSDTTLSSINSTHLSVSNYYRFSANKNTFSLYNLGTSEPTESTSGSLVISAYSDDETFQDIDATRSGAGCLYTAVSAQTVRLGYLAVSGRNYLSSYCDFDNVFYFFADSSMIGSNLVSEFEKFYKIDDFSYHLNFSPSSGGPVNQTIFWLGTEDRDTAFRISYSTSTQKITVKLVNLAGVSTDLVSTSTFSSGTFYDVSIVKNGADFRIYINGVSDASTALASNFDIFDLTANGSPAIIVGADIVGTAFGESNDIHIFNGNLSALAAYNYGISSDDIEAMYLSFTQSADTPKNSTDLFFTDERIYEGGGEETFSYPMTNGYSSDQAISKLSYSSYLVSKDSDIKSNYYWTTRQKSNSSKVMTTKDFFKISFDSHPCNKILLSTGHDLGGVDEFDLEFGDENGSIGTSSYSFDGQSMKIISLDDKYDITYIKVTINSTQNANDFGRIYSVNPIWEVDLSDYVISFDISKVRDNLDASLPIGATSANSGSMTFDNSEQIFTPFGTGQYKDYVYPDTIFFISTSHQLSDGVEDIKISDYMYADSWSFDNSSMTTSVDFRDYSKYLQEETISSYYSQFLNAGKACKEILFSAGLPARKIKYFDTYRNTVAQDNPSVFMPLNETKIEMESLEDRYNAGDYYAGVIDFCDTAFVTSQMSTGYETDASIVKSEYFIYQDDSQRVNDGLSIRYFNPEVKYGSYKSGSLDSVFYARKNYPISSNVYWTFIEDSNWSFEFLSIADRDDLTNYASYIPIFYSKNYANTDVNFKISHKPKADNKISFEIYAKNSAGSEYTIESPDIDRSISHLIQVTKSSAGTLALYIDGKLIDATPLSGSFASGFSFRVAADNKSYISYFSKFDYVLSEDQLSKHYISSVIPLYNNFKYVYSFDQTYWDAMLEIATADIGMFYFNEDGDFVYEHRTSLNDNLFNRYQISQYDLSDDINIISGSLRTDVQTNKVIVKVSNSSIDVNSLSSLWSPSDGESLAVTTITSDISPLSQDIQLDNAENPLWLPEGYLKINDEIIKYELLSGNKLSNLTRGMFGTKTAWHLSSTKAREVRVYDIEYSSKPAVDVRYPFITGNLFYSEVDIEYFEASASGARVIVSATNSVNTGSLAILQGTNATTNIQYGFSISGLTVQENQSKESFEDQSSEIRDNIRRYRVKELTIENKFIQNKIYAKILSQYILSYFSSPVPILDVSITGVPHLQLGDLVTITKFDDLGIVNEKYWIIENSIQYDGGLSQDLVLRRYAEPVVPEQFFVNSDIISLGFSPENELDSSTDYNKYL